MSAHGQRLHGSAPRVAYLASEVACDGGERLARNPVGPLLKPVRPGAQVKGRPLGTASWRVSKPVRHDSSFWEPGAVPFSERCHLRKHDRLTCASAGAHLLQLVPHLPRKEQCKAGVPYSVSGAVELGARHSSSPLDVPASIRQPVLLVAVL